VNEVGDVRLAYSSIRTICDNADRITESAKSGTTKVSAKKLIQGVQLWNVLRKC
jgi:hypothetical protein